MEKSNSNNNVTLDLLVYKSINKTTAFTSLDYCEQAKVLKYINDNKINYRVFGLKGFDIIKQNFFAEEYYIDKYGYLEKKKLVFNEFSSLFDNVGFNIYDNNCFFGYEFKEKEINKIDINRINFDSFINYNIDDFSFNHIIKNNDKIKQQYLDSLDRYFNWINKVKKIDSYDSFKRKYKNFIREFALYDPKSIFFSLMMSKFQKKIEDYVIRFLCEFDEINGLTFDDILLKYDEEAAQKVIDNFIGVYSESTRKKKIRNFKLILGNYNEEEYKIYSSSGFDNKKQVYYVNLRYSNGSGKDLYTKMYFLSFKAFIKFLDKDLRYSDLSNAPVDREFVYECKINNETKLPKPTKFDHYCIEKGYDNDFYVCQKWYDGQNKILLEDVKHFDYIFDYVHFLKNDLSNGDYLLCDGFENIKHIKNIVLDNVHLRSYVCAELCLPIKEYYNTKNIIDEKIEDNEIENIVDYNVQHLDDESRVKISYVSDIHLIHRFFANKGKSVDDLNYIIRKSAKNLKENESYINLIDGDIASDIEVYKRFIAELRKSKSNYFISLGNHELWFRENQSLESIYKEYEEILKNGNLYLLNNNAYYITDDGIIKISEEQLLQESSSELKKLTRDAYLVIFGGIGFAGNNKKFNAENGIYRDTISREQEISESLRFETLYNKVIDSFAGKNLIVMSHMPFSDWSSSNIEKNVIYISGHNHKNYYYDDAMIRIYSDNQIGYKQKEVRFKKLSINYDYDWFSEYNDGIYEISRDDYIKFYRGIREGIDFNREFKKIYMLKRYGIYMFLILNKDDKLLLLNGGSSKLLKNNNLNYYYDNLINYCNSIKEYIKEYDCVQREISNRIKLYGGSGYIHGCIIDIDFFNHIYVNPIDGKLTSYYAESMVDKTVYKNFISMVKYKCPTIYENIKKEIGYNKTRELDILGSDLVESKETSKYYSTDIYKFSRIIKNIQFANMYNVVRIWNDTLINKVSKENGKLLIEELLKLK